MKLWKNYDLHQLTSFILDTYYRRLVRNLKTSQILLHLFSWVVHSLKPDFDAKMTNHKMPSFICWFISFSLLVTLRCNHFSFAWHLVRYLRVEIVQRLRVQWPTMEVILQNIFVSSWPLSQMLQNKVIENYVMANRYPNTRNSQSFRNNSDKTGFYL